jgi:signal transduction histidine kinase
VVVTLVDDARTGLRIEAMAGEGPRDILGDTIPLDGTLSGLVVGSGRAQRLTPGDNRLRHVLADRLDPRAGLVVPLLHRGAVLGTLAAFERDGDRVFSEEEEELLTGFAASAAISVGTARRVSEQQRRRAVEASERERARWARELHDETLQELAGLRVLLAKAAGDPAAVETALEQIELSITGLRQLITELRPAALDQYGVAAALEALIERERAATGIDIRAEIALAYEAGLADRRHTPELEITIYRIVQEAVHNAVKHAAADVITASVQEGESDVVVEVHDDGRGFDTDQASDGFGLVGIR